MITIDQLREFSLFAAFNDDDLRIISQCARLETAPKGCYLAREGESADKCFAVQKGRLVIEIHLPQREPMAILTVHPGQVAGWSWIFPPYRWSADVRALDPLEYVALDGRCLRTYCESHPALGFALMKKFAQLISHRLSATRIQLMDVYGKRSQQEGEGHDVS